MIDVPSYTIQRVSLLSYTIVVIESCRPKTGNDPNCARLPYFRTQQRQMSHTRTLELQVNMRQRRLNMNLCNGPPTRTFTLCPGAQCGKSVTNRHVETYGLYQVTLVTCVLHRAIIISQGIGNCTIWATSCLLVTFCSCDRKLRPWQKRSDRYEIDYHKIFMNVIKLVCHMISH